MNKRCFICDYVYVLHYRCGLWIYTLLYTWVLIPTQSCVHIFLENDQRTTIVWNKKKRKHRFHLLFMHTHIFVLNYRHSYFITVHHVTNSNWLWCLSAALDDNRIPWIFLSLEAKEGEAHLHSSIALPLRFYIAFNSLQLLGA